MELRPYQKEAMSAITRDLIVAGNSICVLPCGSGKSHLIASTATLSSPVLILQPSQELLRQNVSKLELLVPAGKIGVYSASFNRREVRKFTFATIQSVYKSPELFQDVKLVIIDECHGVSVKSLGTMYMAFLSALNVKVIGLTASPYRLTIGYVVHSAWDMEQVTMLKLINRMREKNQKEMFWKRIIYHISHAELIHNGYLVPLKYIHKPLLPYAEIPINKSHSDYNLEAYTDAIVGLEAKIFSTIAEAQRLYKHLLVFCATVSQAQHLSSVIKGSAIVSADTGKKERQRMVEDFKSGAIQTVFNVGVLTTGFDFPELDCIVLLRPTRSLVLYQQILGRLSRVGTGKEYGTVIDFTGTCKALGRIETFSLYRTDRGLWDLRTERHDSWHNRVLYSRTV